MPSSEVSVMIDPVKRRHNRRNLVAACAALRTVAPFPFFGTLLGLTREGDIIKGDDDVDLYIDARDLETACALLRGAGFDIAADVWPNHTPYFRQATRHLDGVKTFVDIYFYDSRPDSPWIIDRWNFIGQPQNPEYHLCVNKDLIFPLKTQRIFGAEIFMPRRLAKCCRYLYGPTWQKKASKQKGEYSIVIHQNQPHFLHRESIANKLHLKGVARMMENDQLHQRLAAMAAERDAMATERDRALAEYDVVVDQRNHCALESEAMRVERDQLVVERDAVIVQRDEAVAERESLSVLRDAAVQERDAMVQERDAAVEERHAATVERDMLKAERDDAVAAREAMTAERDQAVAAGEAMRRERDDAKAERDAMALQRDHMTKERDGLAAQRDHVAMERDGLALQRDHALAERDAMVVQRDHAVAERDAAMVRRDPVPGEPGKGLGRLFKAGQS